MDGSNVLVNMIYLKYAIDKRTRTNQTDNMTTVTDCMPQFMLENEQ